MKPIVLKFYKNKDKDAGEESTMLDSDDYSSAATGSDGGKRGKRPHESPQPSGGGELILAGCKRRIVRREEPGSEAERAMTEQMRAAEEGRRALGLDTGDPRTADVLARQAATDVDIICTVAARSSNLKGTFQRALQDAAASIKAIVAAFKDRTATDEVRKLQVENARLRSEMDELRQHVAELRHERGTSSPILPIQTGRVEKLDEMRASITASVGRMFDARFAALEDRLLPERPLRPPLAADKKRQRRRRRRALRLRLLALPALRRGRRKRLETRRQHPPQQQPPARRKPKKRKLAAPRSPAVLITLDEYAVSKGVTYCHLLERAAEQIDLESLGIKDGLTIRRAATGARLLELPKGQTPEAAKRLAEELQTVCGSLARVVQPMKLASLRVSGLDDSVTSEAVAVAVAKLGKCDAGDIKVGAIAVGPGGLGGTVVRCPIPAAKALAEGGRLLVGWSSARVQVLEQRPMRCFKCMGIGHTRPTCPAAVDRRGACYRCGVEGHIARNCTGALRCAVCADAGKPASHIMGGRECRPPKSRVRAAAAKAPTAPQNTSHQVTEETAAMSS
ncbi:unnamed protein product [Euphydryas editha]|uniref:CCHC-type domain-containing protein n=1 Tax=Euphydryas editha TaxID=104508 RepID=A0AAU9TDS4_EUPED|nr:unnamed protein product [Euphydryas editha]